MLLNHDISYGSLMHDDEFLELCIKECKYLLRLQITMK